MKTNREKKTVEVLLGDRSSQNQETRETLKEIRENLKDLQELFEDGYINRNVYDYHKNKILNSYIVD